MGISFYRFLCSVSRKRVRSWDHDYYTSLGVVFPPATLGTFQDARPHGFCPPRTWTLCTHIRPVGQVWPCGRTKTILDRSKYHSTMEYRLKDYFRKWVLLLTPPEDEHCAHRHHCPSLCNPTQSKHLMYIVYTLYSTCKLLPWHVTRRWTQGRCFKWLSGYKDVLLSVRWHSTLLDELLLECHLCILSVDYLPLSCPFVMRTPEHQQIHFITWKRIYSAPRMLPRSRIILPYS